MFTASRCLLMMILLHFIQFLHAQQDLVLQHRNLKHRQIRLKAGSDFTLYTKNGKWESSVIGLTDSTITVLHPVRTGRDTTYTQRVPKTRKHPDGIKKSTQKIWVTDTVELKMEEVLLVKRPWIRKRGWALIPAYFLAGAILAVPLLPVAAISKGKEGVRNWLQFEGLLLGVSGPPLLLLSFRKKYELGHKWTLHRSQLAP